MQAIRKTYLKVFSLGAGMSVLFLFTMDTWSISKYIHEAIFTFLLWPGRIVNPTTDLLAWLCHNVFKDPNLCRGLALDGGPLAWVEFASIFVAVALWWGFLFCLIYFVYKKMYEKSVF